MRLGIVFTGEGLALKETVALAQRAEAAGFESAWTVERSRSAIVLAVAIGLQTQRLRVGTGVVLPLPRTPASLALDALDAAEALGGRFILGLGSGARARIEGLHGIPADHRAARMREFVQALRLLFVARDGAAVRFAGEFVQVDGVVFQAERPSQPPPIYLAAVNPLMLRVAGGYGDGWLGAPLMSVRFLREVAEPQLERGAAQQGRSKLPEKTALLVTSVAATTDQARERARLTIAQYCRPEHYDVVLKLHGFEEAASAIRAAFAAGDLAAAARAVPEALLEEVAIVGTPAECRAKLERYEGLLDVAILYPPTAGLSAEELREAHQALLEAFASQP